MGNPGGVGVGEEVGGVEPLRSHQHQQKRLLPTLFGELAVVEGMAGQVDQPVGSALRRRPRVVFAGGAVAASKAVRRISPATGSK
ncbi:hypothetical protein BH18ACT6_BH18ACT6_06180 [soil metagenome]